jgi:hypothetical protein
MHIPVIGRDLDVRIENAELVDAHLRTRAPNVRLGEEEVRAKVLSIEERRKECK